MFDNTTYLLKLCRPFKNILPGRFTHSLVDFAGCIGIASLLISNMCADTSV